MVRRREALFSHLWKVTIAKRVLQRLGIAVADSSIWGSLGDSLSDMLHTATAQ